MRMVSILQVSVCIGEGGEEGGWRRRGKGGERERRGEEGKREKGEKGGGSAVSV